MDDEDLGKPQMKIMPVYALVGAALVSLLIAGLSGSARGEDVQDPSPLQVMADAVLIDTRCRDTPVNFGALMHYGEQHGIAAADILPLGLLRKSFDAAFRQRSNSLTPDAICTSLVSQEQDLVPGILKLP